MNCYVIDIGGAVISGQVRTIDGIEQFVGDGSVCVRMENYPQYEMENDSQYETVEITIDNWADYFEIISIDDWKLNGFGESEGYNKYYSLKLREEFHSRINVESISLTVEMLFTHSYNHVDVNFDEMKYTIGDVSENQIKECSEVWEITRLQDDFCTSNAIRADIDVYEIGDRIDCYISVISNLTVGRIQGTIELIAE